MGGSMERGWSGFVGLRWLVVLIALGFTAACTSSRPVQIPPEWQTSAPAPPAPHPAVQTPPQAHAAPSGPIIRRPPEFREKDLAPGLEPALPPGQQKAEARPPQYLASMHLVEQGKSNLAAGRPEAAIGLFEQAVQVDVHNGEAFLGLAKAWRMRGSGKKALEFARKAEILFQDDPRKLKEVYLLEADILSDLGDAAQSNQYRQKASRL